MWVVTVYNNDAISMFEYNTKQEALNVMETMKTPAILSYTNLSFVA